MNNLNDSLKLYFNLKSDDIGSIAGLFTEETLNRSDYFLHKDKVYKKLSFIKNGILRIYSFSNGKMTVLPKWIFSVMGWFIPFIR